MRLPRGMAIGRCVRATGTTALELAQAVARGIAERGSYRETFYAAFAARRASLYLLIFDFGTFLCFAQTIPNTGAAGFLQPGTGQNCRGGFFRAGRPEATAALDIFGGRPRRRPAIGARAPNAASTAPRARSTTCVSSSALSLLANSSMMVRISISVMIGRKTFRRQNRTVKTVGHYNGRLPALEPGTFGSKISNKSFG
jgi:hypothetical protein